MKDNNLFILNATVADNPAMQGARASAAMVSTSVFQNVSLEAPEG